MGVVKSATGSYALGFVLLSGVALASLAVLTLITRAERTAVDGSLRLA
jgi:hypothetical protein